MILDRLENWSRYFASPLLEQVRVCLAGLGPDSALGERPIQDRDAWVNVFDGQLRPLDQALFEAHRIYADIQVVLAGHDSCGWAPLSPLIPQGEYDPAKDVAFFQLPSSPPDFFTLQPGLFAVFFPDDAHLPQIGGPGTVRKAVAKVRADLMK